MSGKKIVLLIVLVVVTVLVNVQILKDHDDPSNSTLQICIDMISDQETGIDVFYCSEEMWNTVGFAPERCVSGICAMPGERTNISYEIPGNTKYVRIDFGTGTSENSIYSIVFMYGDQIVEISKEQLQNCLEENDVQFLVREDSILAKSNGIDPYLVWDTTDWDYHDMIEEVNLANAKTKNIVVCCIFDLFMLVVFIKYNMLSTMLGKLLLERKLLFQLSKNDFKSKYSGSYLGMFWAFVQPIVTVVVYWFVFSKAMHAADIVGKNGITVPFVLWLVAGLVPWFFFQEALNGGAYALVEYSYLVKKVVFKITLLPIVKMLSALFVNFFFILFMLVLFCGYHYYPALVYVQLIYYVMYLFLFTLGISYITSALTVFFRDLMQVISIILQVGIWITPIMWNMDGMNMAPWLMTIFKLNPLYYVVKGFRDTLINHTLFIDDMCWTVYYWLVVAIVMWIGLRLFDKLKIHFADVL